MSQSKNQNQAEQLNHDIDLISQVLQRKYGFDIIESIIERNSNDLHTMMLLHIDRWFELAFYGNAYESVDLILTKYGVEPETLRMLRVNDVFREAMHINKQVEVFELILNKVGASIEALRMIEIENAFYMSVHYERIEILKLIFSTCDKNLEKIIKKEDIRRTFFCAINNNSAEIVELLFARYSKSKETIRSLNITEKLEYAIMGEKTDIVTLIITKCCTNFEMMIELNIADVLIMAAIRTQTYVVELILNIFLKFENSISISPHIIKMFKIDVALEKAGFPFSGDPIITKTIFAKCDVNLETTKALNVAAALKRAVLHKHIETIYCIIDACWKNKDLSIIQQLDLPGVFQQICNKEPKTEQDRIILKIIITYNKDIIKEKIISQLKNKNPDQRILIDRELAKLSYAIQYEYFRAIKFIIKHNSNDLQTIILLRVDIVLQFAFDHDRVELVDLILTKYGIEPEILQILNVDNVLREIIVENKRVKIFELILNRCSANIEALRVIQIENAFYTAIYYKRVEILKLIFAVYDKNLEKIMKKEELVQAFSCAINSNSTEIVNLFFTRHDASEETIKLLNINKALQSAASGGQVEVLKMIFAKFDTSFEIIEKEIAKAFSCAINSNSTEIVDLFFTRYDASKEIIKLLNIDKVLLKAASNGQVESVKLIFSKFDINFEIMFELNIAAALISAVEEKKIDVVNLILTALLKFKDGIGISPSVIDVCQVDVAFQKSNTLRNEAVTKIIFAKCGVNLETIKALNVAAELKQAVCDQNLSIVNCIIDACWENRDLNIIQQLDLPGALQQIDSKYLKYEINQQIIEKIQIVLQQSEETIQQKYIEQHEMRVQLAKDEQDIIDRELKLHKNINDIFQITRMLINELKPEGSQ